VGSGLRAAGDHLLQIQDLTVTYSQRNGAPLRALEKFSLSVAPGEVVGIVGESGCGKSTLANAVMGLLPASGVIEEGRILLGDSNVLEMSEAQLCAIRGIKISLMPQEPALSLNPVMTAAAQLEEVLKAHLTLRRRDRKELVSDLLQELGFEDPSQVADAYPHQLSGGQRQRIVLAQAIACKPDLLIADEPTSKLDPSLRSEIADLLAKLHGKYGMAIVVISHDLALLASLASRIVLMYAGRVVENAPRAAMVAGPLHPYGKELFQLARSSAIGAVGSQPAFRIINRENVEGRADGCPFEPRCGERMSDCAHGAPPEVRPAPGRTVTCFKYGE
jgi:peptide/nickel transport system ATP-binding protein